MVSLVPEASLPPHTALSYLHKYYTKLCLILHEIEIYHIYEVCPEKV